LKKLNPEKDQQKFSITEDKIKELTFTKNQKTHNLLELTTGKNKIINILIVIGLITIAFIKTGALLVLATFDSMVAYMVFLLLFLIIVYAHINHTPYAQSYLKAKKILKKEYKKYLKGDDETYKVKELRQIFNTEEPLNLPIETNIGHKVIEAKGGEKNDVFSGDNFYIAIYNGVPIDSDLREMSLGQTEDNKLRVFYAGRNTQFHFAQKKSTEK